MESLAKSLDKIRVPQTGDRVYKDECVYSFDSPESDAGLYVCLNTFRGLSKDWVKVHYEKTGNNVFLRIRRIRNEVTSGDGTTDDTKPNKIKRLAIGLEGGYNPNQTDKVDVEEINTLVILPLFEEISLPNENLPEQVIQSISAVLGADSAFKLEEMQALSGTWDGEKRKVSKHADALTQLDNGIKIPPKGWKCDLCDLRDNLWLNLTSGAVLCGRKFFDGSGGNNHALEYYKETNFPLAVKLGTITASGGDVYSYDEDDMVEDPHLAKHLAHFGINITLMEKTDKSMIELEIDMNEKIGEWSIIQESESELVPLFGPGFTGMENLGNSCYMNSVMQLAFQIPDFERRYYKDFDKTDANAVDPAQDFETQMCKLGDGLLSGRYSKKVNDEQKEQKGIRPSMFKNLIGRNHVEFSTKRQQDAQEFLLHLINSIERNNRVTNKPNPTECFKFMIEERIQCIESKKVAYNTRCEYILSLPIPMDRAVNTEDVANFESKKAKLESLGEKLETKEKVRPRIPLQACFETFAGSEAIDDFYSTALNRKSVALKSSKLATFPDYLIIQLKKFTLGDDWVPKKLDISVNVPDQIDLISIRGTGRQATEECLPDFKPTAANVSDEDNSSNNSNNGTTVVNIDPSVLAQLTEMGFPVDACRRAIYSTQNSGLEAATNWIMEHMGDPDFSAPFALGQGSSSSSSNNNNASDFSPDSEAVATIVSMGFSEDDAKRALKATGNNTERAIDWIFSHAEETMHIDEQEERPPQYRDGSEKYKLVGFVSHMGTSTMCGHYVCHVLKDGEWVIFNDNKVAVSVNPPKEFGYLYLFRRI